MTTYTFTYRDHSASIDFYPVSPLNPGYSFAAIYIDGEPHGAWESADGQAMRYAYGDMMHDLRRMDP